MYLQKFKRGRASTVESVLEILKPLTDKIMEERSNLSFSPTLRGWCYLLEGLCVCSKGEFSEVMSRITRARKLGLLPLDITAEDDTRSTSGGCSISQTLERLVRSALESIPWYYSTTTIEEYTGVHIELFVEKLDLVGMLQDVTRTYKIPVTCSRGWSDLHSRAALLRRCADYDMPTVILMFGDHDPGGLSITDSFKDNLDDLFIASGLTVMPDINFERVGLNASDIDELGLLWIDGLETSSGKDLASPSHPDFKSKPVQDYLSLYGARKCEANALLRCPKEAEKILLRAIKVHISESQLMAYQEHQLKDRQEATKAVNKVFAVI